LPGIRNIAGLAASYEYGDRASRASPQRRVSGRFALVYPLRPGRVQELNLATGQQRSVPVAAADTPVGAAW
jgi:hypothetical protein